MSVVSVTVFLQKPFAFSATFSHRNHEASAVFVRVTSSWSLTETIRHLLSVWPFLTELVSTFQWHYFPQKLWDISCEALFCLFCLYFIQTIWSKLPMSPFPTGITRHQLSLSVSPFTTETTKHQLSLSVSPFSTEHQGVETTRCPLSLSVSPFPTEITQCQ